MENPNPFTPPKSPLSQAPDNTLGSPWKAVFLGILADVGGTIVASILYAFIYSAYLDTTGMPVEDIEAMLLKAPPDSAYALIGYGIGLFFSVLGGYVCARIAKQSEYRLASIMALLSGSLSVLTSPDHYLLVVNIALITLSLIGLFFGAYLGRMKNQKAVRFSA